MRVNEVKTGRRGMGKTMQELEVERAKESDSRVHEGSIEQWRGERDRR